MDHITLLCHIKQSMQIFQFDSNPVLMIKCVFINISFSQVFVLCKMGGQLSFLCVFDTMSTETHWALI